MGQRLLLTLLVLGVATTTRAYDFSSITGALATGGDLFTASVNTGKSLVEKVPDLIPNPSTIFTLSKEAIVGLPFKALFEAINQICSVALSGNGTQSKYTPDINQLGFVLITSNDNVTVPLLKPEELWSHPLFDRNLNTVLLITGWTTDLSEEQDSTIDTVYNAYKARGNHNFIVLDPAKFIDSLYTWSAFNTEEIGKYVGMALSKLTVLYPREKIHVIGHSLGGQISGAAGRYYYAQKNQLLPRITGLDPANPCFNEGEALTGLYRGDAEFVDIIHTNNGALGQKQPIGDVDFYPNGVSVLQPGCLSIMCAHARSWKYYAETVYPGNEENFIGTRCNSLASLGAHLCPGSGIPMGYRVPKDVKGNYFFKTSGSSPFGKNSKEAIM